MSAVCILYPCLQSSFYTHVCSLHFILTENKTILSACNVIYVHSEVSEKLKIRIRGVSGWTFGETIKLIQITQTPTPTQTQTPHPPDLTIKQLQNKQEQQKIRDSPYTFFCSMGTNLASQWLVFTIILAGGWFNKGYLPFCTTNTFLYLKANKAWK